MREAGIHADKQAGWEGVGEKEQRGRGDGAGLSLIDYSPAWISWSAQGHCPSLPLAGLVSVGVDLVLRVGDGGAGRGEDGVLLLVHC